jgi:hypothetical protein
MVRATFLPFTECHCPYRTGPSGPFTPSFQISWTLAQPSHPRRQLCLPNSSLCSFLGFPRSCGEFDRILTDSSALTQKFRSYRRAGSAVAFPVAFPTCRTDPSPRYLAIPTGRANPPPPACISHSPQVELTPPPLPPVSRNPQQAELAAVCNEAGLEAMRDDISTTRIESKHFSRAVATVGASAMVPKLA